MPLGEHGRHDWQDNGEARHVGARLPNGIRLENVYIPAGGDIPDPAVNPKFAQKLAFVERMTRWSEDLREPTLIVGDFNIAPLESDVWSHKQLLDVVSHTPVEVEALGRLQAAHDWVDLGRHFVPRTATTIHLVELSCQGLGGLRSRPPARSYVGEPRGREDRHRAPRPRGLPELAQALRPCSARHRVRLVSARRETARGIDALRRGWPIVIADGADRLVLLPIETADADRLAAFAPDGRFDVLLSPERAATLMLANQRAAASAGLSGAVRVAHAPWLDLDTATALADPARDLSTPLKGPFRTIDAGSVTATVAALKLARIAGLLPAFFVREGEAPSDAPTLTAAEIGDYDSPSHLRIASRARLPVDAAEGTEIVAFRSAEEAGRACRAGRRASPTASRRSSASTANA